MIPTTAVTPIPSRIAPAVSYGAPVPAVGAPVGGAPLSFYAAGYGPWGYGEEAGTGWAPGIYTSDVAMMGYW